MYNFFHVLTNETNPKLTDKSNVALKRLYDKHHQIGNYVATFHQPADYYQLGIVEFANKENIVLTALYSIYINKGVVYARLLTLDKILLLDTPYEYFLSDLKRYIKTGSNVIVH